MTTNFICFTNLDNFKIRDEERVSFTTLIEMSKVLIYGCNTVTFDRFRYLDRVSVSHCSTLEVFKPTTLLKLAGPVESLQIREASGVNPFRDLDLSKFPSMELLLSGHCWEIARKSIASRNVKLSGLYHMENLTLQSESLKLLFDCDPPGDKPPVAKSITGSNLCSLEIQSTKGGLCTSDLHFPNLEKFNYECHSRKDREPLNLLQDLPRSLLSMNLRSYNSDLMFRMNAIRFINLEELEFSVNMNHIGMTKEDYGVFPKLKKLRIEHEIPEKGGISDICFIPEITAPRLEEFTYHHQGGRLTDSDLLSTLKMYPGLKSFQLFSPAGLYLDIDQSLRFACAFTKMLRIWTSSMDVFCDSTVEFPVLVSLFVGCKPVEGSRDSSCYLCCTAQKLTNLYLDLPDIEALLVSDYPKLRYAEIYGANVSNVTLGHFPEILDLDIHGPLRKLKINGEIPQLSEVLLYRDPNLTDDEVELDLADNYTRKLIHFAPYQEG